MHKPFQLSAHIT